MLKASGTMRLDTQNYFENTGGVGRLGMRTSVSRRSGTAYRLVTLRKGSMHNLQSGAIPRNESIILTLLIMI